MATTLRAALLVIVVGGVLAGCGGGGSDGDAASEESSSAPASTSFPPPAPATPTEVEVTLSDKDIYACQSFVDDTVGQAHGWLENALATGSGDLYEPGGEAFYNIGGFALLFEGQLTNEPLATTIHYIADHNQQIRDDWDAGTINPNLWLMTFETAADACEDGGFVISWN